MEDNKLSDIFFELKEKRLLSSFYRETLMRDRYRSVHSFIGAFNHYAFGIVNKRCDKSIEAIEKILTQYQEFSTINKLKRI